MNSFVVLKHLLQIPPNKNFFMLHWMLDPHYPYELTEESESRIDVDESKLSEDKDYYAKGISGTVELTEAERRYAKDLYIAEVESVDERIGFMIKMLEHKGLMDRTYIVFTSDHGEQFGDHGLYGHGGFGRDCHFYEGLMEVPLIITGPNISSGRRIQERISLIDLMPTLKDLLGIEYEADVQGTSHASALFEQSGNNATLYFDDVQEHKQIDSLLENDYKLICLNNDRFELYNLMEDAKEAINLAPYQPKLVRSMFKKIAKIREDNEKRKKRKIAAIDDNIDQLSNEERQKILQQLRSLGYIE
jgi:arylsulfatase A-like enzyme